MALTPERRSAAKRLLQVGCYRPAHNDEMIWEDHPRHHLEAYPGYELEPIEFGDEFGNAYQDGCGHADSRECLELGCPGWRPPRPYGEERQALEAGVNAEPGCIVLSDSQPALPSPSEIEAEEPTLEMRTSLSWKLQHSLGEPQSPQKPEPRYFVVKPTPPPDDFDSALKPISW